MIVKVIAPIEHEHDDHYDHGDNQIICPPHWWLLSWMPRTMIMRIKDLIIITIMMIMRMTSPWERAVSRKPDTSYDDYILYAP